MPVENGSGETAAQETVPETSAAAGGASNAGSSSASGGAAAADQGAEAAAAVPETYIIGEGETLHGICLKFYHNLSKMDEICRINGLDDPNKIISGQKLVLP